MNLAEVLERVGGSKTLLRELIELFLEEYPHSLEEIRNGLRQGEPQRVRHAAHQLRGSVGNFTTQAAYEAARRMETCAHTGDLACAAAAWPGLEDEVCRFVADLAGLLAWLQTETPGTAQGQGARPEEVLT